MSQRGSAPVLVTIPISHYCEKARWALDRADIAFEEQPHLPAVHRFAVRRAGGGLTVPVLVCDDRVLADSADIVAWADEHLPESERLRTGDPAIDAEADALAAAYDEHFGPDTRRWAYYGLRDQRSLVNESICHGVPSWQRRTFRATYRPITFTVNKVLNITAETAAASERAAFAVLDEVGARLADGRRFLLGDRFTTADLTFASLAAPLVMPREYGSPLLDLEDLPPAMAASVERARAMPAGDYVLRLFREERQPRAGR